MQTGNRNKAYARNFFLRGIGTRQDNIFKTMLDGFFETFLTIGYRTDFS